MLNIEQQQKETGGTFIVQEGDKLLAEMSYSLPEQGIMTIDHTEVDESLRGKNIGMQLLNKAVGFARENHLMIKPYCPYVRSVFERKTALFKDVWMQ